ncbi:hypothetical protein EGW08_011026 [Elysia chlorotica]|uniref:Receptor ligand binding region domain-containing protein n=1 Tax=Elysia chlorotica TaxID=188477 RepID=A0A3S1BD66_ELYCH|nr:hypothetical protein EGW08_011026 [Elysia chlorotica]
MNKKDPGTTLLPSDGCVDNTLDSNVSNNVHHLTVNSNATSRESSADIENHDPPLGLVDLGNNLKSVDSPLFLSTTTDSVLYTDHSPALLMNNSQQTRNRSLDTSRANTMDVILVLLVPQSDFFMFSRAKIITALDIAQAHLQTSGITSDFRIRFLFGDSQCSEIIGPIRAFEFVWQDRVDAFLGPACDYSVAPVARYAAYWRVPVLSPGALSFDFVTNKRTQYRTLTRVGASLTSVALLLMKLMDRHGWGKLLLVYDPLVHISHIPKLCFLTASAISYISRRRGFEAKPEFSGDPEEVLRGKVGTDYAGE